MLQTILLVAMASSLLAQDLRERQLWNTEFLNQRPAAAGATAASASKVTYKSKTAATVAPPAGANASVLGITLWRMRAPKQTESAATRLLVLDSKAPATSSPARIELVPERMEADTRISQGDQIRIAVESVKNAYLYVIDRELYADGTYSAAYLIYPNRQTRQGDNFLAPGRLIEIPDQRDAINTFTLRSSQPSQTAEVLTLLVSPTPLPNLKIGASDSGTPIDRNTFAEWEKKYGAPFERSELEGGAGTAWTEQEKLAGLNRDKLLTRTDAPPQSLFRVLHPQNNPYLVQIQIAFNK